MSRDGMGDSWAERSARFQAILNARPIPDRRLQNARRAPIPVVARIVWARDGIELIKIRDPRWHVHGVRVDAGDVRRR